MSKNDVVKCIDCGSGVEIYNTKNGEYYDCPSCKASYDFCDLILKILELKQKEAKMKKDEQIKLLREEIKELNAILGLTKTRPEYLKAVKLWRKDTGHSNLTYPDLGRHWEWALKFIEEAMK